MLILKPVGPGVAGYYLRQGTGVWMGEAPFRLGLNESVQKADLASLLRGRDPSNGVYLPRVRSARRRAGWDLVFAAPKSLSLFAATASENEMAGARYAQIEAVRGAVGHLQRDIGRAIVAAAFDHSVNAGAEPHLHTHVLVANLAAGREGWGAIGKWMDRDELAAVYHLGLRHHLEQAGLPLRWRIRSDGMPDLIEVPRAAVRAASTRAHESRIGPAYLGRSAPARNWRDATTDAGWSVDKASRAASEQLARDGSAVSPDCLDARVAALLLMNGSSFTRRDVIDALGRATPRGFDAEAAVSWADAFCQNGIPVGTPGEVRRWTTPLAQGADRRLVDALEARRRSGAVVVLTADAGQSNFLADATVLGACASVWAEAGMTVAIASTGRDAQERWAALTGIAGFHPSRRPDVLVVDQAERRPAGEMLALASAARDSTLVFIEGGTCPRARIDTSFGYGQVAAGAVRADPGPSPGWNALSPEQAGRLPSRSAARVAGQLIHRWAGAARAERHPPLMVGLGLPEVIALNEAGRRHLLDSGTIDGPSLQAWGRSFQAGDRVLAFGRSGNGIPPGMPGTVRSVDARKRIVTIDWPTGGLDMKPLMLAKVGHAYAATPRLASRMQGSVFVLGRAEGLGLDLARVAVEMSVDRPAPELGRERHPVGRGLA